MTEIKNEETPKMAQADADRINKLILQGRNKLSLITKEKDLRNKLQEFKLNNKEVKEGNSKPNYLYMQEFHNIIAELESVNHEHYLTNANDAISREDSSIKGMLKMIEDSKEDLK